MYFKFISLGLILCNIFICCKCFSLYSMSTTLSNYYCRTIGKECCNEDSIPVNLTKLLDDLNEKVYGQHIAVNTILYALDAHWGTNRIPQKALALSFHGWPGSGKNYITNFIVDNLFANGAQSSYVHKFVGRIKYPDASKVYAYQRELYDHIKTKVESCGRQLFIFDEVDKMPKGLLDILKPFLDYNAYIDNVEYRQAIFIFMSNTGAERINTYTYEAWKSGRKRLDMKLNDFDALLSQGAFNEDGGFQYSDNIKKNLIDHYVPFLPLEVRHIRECIISEYRMRGISNPSEEDISEINDIIDWAPQPERLYSKTGCKRINQKVGLAVSKLKYKQKQFRSEL